MEGQAQIIMELQEQVEALQKRICYLEKLLDELGISYNKECNDSREDTENAVNIQNQNESQENQGSRIISEAITKDHAKFFIPCSRVGQMFTAKGQPNPMQRRVRQDIIHSAGISGRMACVRRKKESRSSARTVQISAINSSQVTT